ncbi:MAG: cysteine rich repeat-containing protein [bacterium]
MKNLIIAALGLVITASLAPLAHAFEFGACKKDIEKYCKDAGIEGGALKTCLHQHLAQLSDPCKANLVDIWLEKKQMEGKKESK